MSSYIKAASFFLNLDMDCFLSFSDKSFDFCQFESFWAIYYYLFVTKDVVPPDP